MAGAKGFATKIEWLKEQSFGGGLYNPASATTMKYPSDAVQNVSLKANNDVEAIYDTNSRIAKTILKKAEDYTLSIEYLLQDVANSGKSLIYQAVEGNSIVFLITHGKSTKVYYEAKGGKNNSVEISGEKGEPIKVSEEWLIADVETHTSDPLGSLSNLSHATDLNTELITFDKAIITVGGSEIGYGVNKFSLTINNNPEKAIKAGDYIPFAIPYGKLSVEGSLDVYIEEGGLAHWNDVVGASSANIKISFSNSSMVITVSGAVFKTIDIGNNVDEPILIKNMPFVAKDVSIAF